MGATHVRLLHSLTGSEQLFMLHVRCHIGLSGNGSPSEHGFISEGSVHDCMSQPVLVALVFLCGLHADQLSFFALHCDLILVCDLIQRWLCFCLRFPGCLPSLLGLA
jgi:hypothetical protein